MTRALLVLLVAVALLSGCANSWQVTVAQSAYVVHIGGQQVEQQEVPQMQSAPAIAPQSDMERIVLSAADEFGVPHPLALALLEQESGGDPNSVSWAGARGLLQVMPATAEGIAQELGVASYNLDDPTTNARFGMYYLKGKLDRYGHDWGLAAYNWGPNGVDGFLERHPEAAQMAWSDILAQWGGEIPTETQNYVMSISAIEQRQVSQVQQIVSSKHGVTDSMEVGAAFDTVSCDAWVNQANCQHFGDDMQGGDNDPVFAPFDGTWIETNEYLPGDPTCPRCLGQYIRYKTADGHEMYLGHLKEAIVLQPGQPITAGTIVGKIRGDLAHTHWQCKAPDGSLEDCLAYWNSH